MVPGLLQTPSIQRFVTNRRREELMSRAHHRVNGGPMAAKGNSKIEALTALPGIGAATAKKLVSAKIDTVSKIASAGSKKLQDAGLSAAVAKKVGAAAKAVDKASSGAKKATTKAKAVTKSAAKKSSSAVKNTAAKTKAAAKKATVATKAASKKAASKTKATAKKATVATKAASKKASSKTAEGRKGSTIRVPRSVSGMSWFNKK
tara:strand:- start:1013 stop:1627 length:615 start_codon:yes stop_codon:yes gene_type:complete